MTLSEFLNTFRLHGLEHFQKYYGTYKGFVAYNDDPENMCRLRVCVPSIYGKSIPEYWALPRGVFSGDGLGFVAIPKEADPIWVTFENGDSRFPLWEYGWFQKGHTPKDSGPKNAVFQFAGHRLEFNEKENKVTIKNKAGSVIELSSTGITIDSKVAITIKSTTVVKVDTKAIILNGGGVPSPAVLGTQLTTLLTALLTNLSVATVEVAGIPTPLPLTNAEAFAALIPAIAGINSTKVTLT